MEYMSPKPTSSQSIPPSPLVEIERQLKSEVDWDDLRIRAWGVEERDGNGDYFETLREIATAEFDLKVRLAQILSLMTFLRSVAEQG